MAKRNKWRREFKLEKDHSERHELRREKKVVQMLATKKRNEARGKSSLTGIRCDFCRSNNASLIFPQEIYVCPKHTKKK